MSYRVLADIVLVLHLCFVIFVVFGGLLVARYRSIAWFHLPAVIWGVLIEFYMWTCPLTTLENLFRQFGGEAGYADGFVDYFISAILYTSISPQLRLMLGLLLAGFNLTVYLYAFRRKIFRLA
jgi:hypothetical protein